MIRFSPTRNTHTRLYLLLERGQDAREAKTGREDGLSEAPDHGIDR